MDGLKLINNSPIGIEEFQIEADDNIGDSVQIRHLRWEIRRIGFNPARYGVILLEA
mgnify:CR=1 FL=1